MVFTAKVEKNKLVFDSIIHLSNHLFALDGQRVEVDIRKVKSQRSNNQNSYYWGVVLDILSSFYTTKIQLQV